MPAPNNTNTSKEIDTDGCCYGNSDSGKRCMCMPYDDAWMISAQILSIVAFLISWVWWPAFIICLTALVMHQLVWCCRQSECMLIATHAISVVAALMCSFAGILWIIVRRDSGYCEPFTFYADDQFADDNGGMWDCSKSAIIYAVIAFVDAVLWLAVAGCTITFVNSGRYQKWEDQRSKKTTGSGNDEESSAVEVAAMELAVVSPTEDGENAKVDDVSSTPATAEEYVPPKIQEATSMEVNA